MNLTKLNLLVALILGVTPLGLRAQAEKPPENSTNSKITPQESRAEKVRLDFKAGFESIEGSQSYVGVRAKPGGAYLAPSEELAPILSPEIISASTNQPLATPESVVAVIEPKGRYLFRATAGTNGMLLAVDFKTKGRSLGYGLKSDVLKFKRAVVFRNGTICIERKENGKTLGTNVFELKDDSRIAPSTDGKALVSVGIVHRFDPCK